MDLGTGAGVPGLILAARFPPSRWVLLDASRRRTAFAAEAARALGLGGRVDVVTARAEEAGREARFRTKFGLVVARGFGAPATVAECAAPFLTVGGRLVVSEPPEAPARWPEAGVRAVGLEDGGLVAGCRVLTQTRECPDRFPRRPGIPARRPLF